MAWTLTVGSQTISFGCSLDGLGLMSTPRVKPIVEMDSYANPAGDGRRHGRVRRRGQVVTLEVEARPDHRTADEVWRHLLTVWRADEIRDTPGARAYLTSDTGRRAIGMPVEIEPNQEHRIFDANRATLQFEAFDDLWYGPEITTRVRLITESTGGLPIPADVPYVLGGGSGVSDYELDIAGDVPTWASYSVHGPIQDPFVEVVGVGRLQFRGRANYDQAIVADTRPPRTILLDGNPFPGALATTGARLSDMQLKPGGHRVFFGGYDPTNTAVLEVRHEPAFTSF